MNKLNLKCISGMINNRDRKRFLIPIIYILIIFSCRHSNTRSPVEQTRFMMDTLVLISVYDQKAPLKTIETAINDAFQRMKFWEGRISSTVDTSLIKKIIEDQDEDGVKISPDVYQLIQTSLDIAQKSDGAFDISMGALNQVWDFYSDHPIVPNKKEILLSLEKVDYKNIQLKNNRVFLKNPELILDLGGIAKGFIVDRGVEILHEAGITSGIIEAGGDLTIFGQHPFRENWRIGIRHPRSKEGELFGEISTKAKCIATSGDYERFFIKNGKRYHHILNPKTGFPAEKSISVTIVAENGMLADGYATAVFVLGPEAGLSLIEAIEPIEGLIIFEENGQLQYELSSGLRDLVVLY